MAFFVTKIPCVWWHGDVTYTHNSIWSEGAGITTYPASHQYPRDTVWGHTHNINLRKEYRIPFPKVAANIRYYQMGHR